MTGALSQLKSAGPMQRDSRDAQLRAMRRAFDRIRALAHEDQREIWELCIRYGTGVAQLDDREQDETAAEYARAAEEGR